jgi:hypothetical protein
MLMAWLICVMQHILAAKLAFFTVGHSQSCTETGIECGLWCTPARGWLNFRTHRATPTAIAMCADLSLVLSCRSPRVCVCRNCCRYLSCFRCAYWRRAVCHGGSLQLLEQVCTGFTRWSVRFVRDTVLAPAMLKLPQHKCRPAHPGRQAVCRANCTDVHASATRLPACLDE